MQDYQKQFVVALLAFSARRDVDPALACRHAGIDVQSMTDGRKPAPDARQIENLWINLVHMTGDPLLGLHFGESMQLAALGVVGQIIQTSRNVGEALTHAGSLLSLVTDMFSMQTTRQGRGALAIRYTADQKKSVGFPVTFRQMADYLMVFTIHELDGLLLRKIAPTAVRLPYSVSDPQEYARVMRQRISRTTGPLTIEIRKEFLEEPLISANYDLQQQLWRIVQSLLPKSGDQNSFRGRIYNFLLTNAYLYDMSLKATAANFNISERTLQRRLGDEGVSFLQIVEEVKSQLAICYLTSGNYQIKEVAFMLGYNEPSALVRAFRRWTGKTPSDYLRDTAGR